MKLAADLDGLVTVVLSRRNLAGLLAQLDENIGTREASQIMRRDGDKMVIVVAEEDGAHYEGRCAGVSGPGQFPEQIHPTMCGVHVSGHKKCTCGSAA